MSDKRTDVPVPESERGHSPDGVWSGTVTALSIGLLILVILTMFGMSSIFHWLYPGPPLMDAGAQWEMQNKIPGVAPNQAYDRQEIAADERAYLSEYAWQDETRQIARVPIERGIELMAEHDLSVQWPSSDAGAKRDSNSGEVAR